MSDDVITDLVSQLLRVRSILAADAPGGPAWAATVEWGDELEAQIRSMGRDPDVVDRSKEPAARARRPAQSDSPLVDRLPAGAR